MVTCPFCGHTWRPYTTNPTLCCSHCTRKFRRPEKRVEIVGPDMMLSTTCDVCGGTFDFLTIIRDEGDARIVCTPCLKTLMDRS